MKVALAGSSSFIIDVDDRHPDILLYLRSAMALPTMAAGNFWSTTVMAQGQAPVRSNPAALGIRIARM